MQSVFLKQELAQSTLPFCGAEGQTSGKVQTRLRTQLLVQMVLELHKFKFDSGCLASAKPGDENENTFSS